VTPLTHFTPADLIRLADPFDSVEYVFEVNGELPADSKHESSK
jgi:hypothetical protein